SRLLLGEDARRTAAVREAPYLARTLQTYQDLTLRAGRALDTAGKAGMTLAQARGQLSQIYGAIRQLQPAGEYPERALEAAIRPLGQRTVDAAVALLPPAVRTPVRWAVHAVERALSHALDLGHSR